MSVRVDTLSNGFRVVTDSATKVQAADFSSVIDQNVIVCPTGEGDVGCSDG